MMYIRQIKNGEKTTKPTKATKPTKKERS